MNYLKKNILIAMSLTALGAVAEEPAVFKAINGEWHLYSSTNRALFLDKEKCAETIKVTASLEKGLSINSTNQNEYYGFEITAKEFQEQKPDPRSEWGRYKGKVTISDDEVRITRRLRFTIGGYRETNSIKLSNGHIIVKLITHSILGHSTSICKYE